MDPREALLAALREPHLPQVGWWPLAPGWWLVILLVTALLFALGRALFRYLRATRERYRADAWRRTAKAELGLLRQRLGAQEAPQTLLSEASVLIRRAMLAAHGRQDVAALQGQAWLQSLDAMSDSTRFTEGRAQLLASGPFQRSPACTSADLTDIFDAMESLFARAGSESNSGDDDPARSEA